MAVYFFDLIDENTRADDAYGAEFENFDEACDQAQAILADVVRQALPGDDDRSFGCNVRDAGGHVVYRSRLVFKGERGIATLIG